MARKMKTNRKQKKRGRKPVRRMKPKRRSSRIKTSVSLPTGHQKRYVRGSSGKGRVRNLRAEVQALVSMVFPIMKVAKNNFHGPYACQGNEQQVFEHSHLRVTHLQDMIGKMIDAGNVLMFEPTGGLSATSATHTGRSFDYMGGFIKYTLYNTTNHTAYMEVMEFKTKQSCVLPSPKECWEHDLARNYLRLNTTAPTDYLTSAGTVSGNTGALDQPYKTGWRPTAPELLELHFNYRCIKRSKIVIRPGESVIFTQAFPAFYYDHAKWMIQNFAASSSVAYSSAMAMKQSLYSYWFLHGEDVTFANSATGGNGVISGSAELTCSSRLVDTYRQKPYRFNHKVWETGSVMDPAGSLNTADLYRTVPDAEQVGINPGEDVGESYVKL